MTRIYFIRHGESECNLAKCFTGQKDCALTERGINQALLTADYLKDINFDVVYSSDLVRAYKTCEIVVGGKNSIVKDEKLREIYGGVWEGMKYDEIAKKYLADSIVWHSNLSEARPTGGESVAELYSRIISEVFNISERHKNQTVLIVSHAIPIRCVLCKAKDDSVKNIGKIDWVANSSVTIVDVDESEIKLLDVGHSEHLSKIVTCLPENI